MHGLWKVDGWSSPSSLAQTHGLVAKGVITDLMAPKSTCFLPNTSTKLYNIADNLATYHANNTTCLDYPPYNMDHSILTTACYKTKLKVPNVNSNPQGLQPWLIYPSASIPNCLTWKILYQLPVYKKLVPGGYLAVIFSQAMWKKSWVGCNPAQSKIVVAEVAATTGIEAQVQQLTA